MRIFFAGATGVIGSRVVPLLLAAGHEVSALARGPRSTELIAAMGAHPVMADLFDPASLRRAVAGNAMVINLATHIPAMGLRMLLPRAWAENDRVRHEGSRNLVDAAIAATVESFLQESFAPAYPDRGAEWIDEEVPLEPVRYNRTVLDAEASADRVTSAGGSGVVLRFGAFYGPDAAQTADLVRAVRRGWAPIPARPDALFSSISHDDAATAVMAALGVRPGIYNVVDDEPLQRRDFFNSLAQALEVSPPKMPPAWLAPLLGSLGRLFARSQRVSNRKLRNETRWRPKYPSARDGWPATLHELAG